MDHLSILREQHPYTAPPVDLDELHRELAEIKKAETEAKPFIVGEGNKALANITGAAAELLLEAHTMSARHPIGVEFGGLFAKEAARELEDEGMGTVHLECEVHGQVRCPAPDDCTAEVYSVFLISDAGTAWLENAGKI